jgi:hypothetical protein
VLLYGIRLHDVMKAVSIDREKRKPLTMRGGGTQHDGREAKG